MSIFLLSCNRKWGQHDPHLVLHLGILVESLVPGETGGSKEFCESIHISYWILRDWGSNEILWLASELHSSRKWNGDLKTHWKHPIELISTSHWKGMDEIRVPQWFLSLDSHRQNLKLSPVDISSFFFYINEGLLSIKIFLFYIFSKHCIILLFSAADVAISPC